MPKLTLIRDERGWAGERAEELLKEHDIDYKVEFLNGLMYPKVPQLETPYGTYWGVEGITEFLNTRISQEFKKAQRKKA